MIVELGLIISFENEPQNIVFPEFLKEQIIERLKGTRFKTAGHAITINDVKLYGSGDPYEELAFRFRDCQYESAPRNFFKELEKALSSKGMSLHFPEPFGVLNTTQKGGERMSFARVLPCDKCKKQDQCSDGVILNAAIDTMHVIGSERGHQGGGTITMDCSNGFEPMDEQGG